MGRCQQLYGIWTKHNETSSCSKMLDADMALEHCRKGEFAAGVAQLKRVLEPRAVCILRLRGCRAGQQPCAALYYMQR
jgi:hypothetical protein